MKTIFLKRHPRHNDLWAIKLSIWSTAFILIVIIATFLFPDFVEYQGAIEGYVIDSTTNDPIPGVSVKLLETPRRCYTDSNGYFLFTNLIKGKWWLDFRTREYDREIKTALIRKRGGLISLDTLKMRLAYRSEWPVPEKIKSKRRFSWGADLPEGYSVKRTIRPPQKPRYDTRTARDEKGGEWILFRLRGFAPLLITYMNPDGTMENSCPTGLDYWPVSDFYAHKDSAIITPIYPDPQNDPVFVITLAELRKDSDGDGIIDRYEDFIGLDPENSDTDNDNIGDLDDPFPTIPKSDEYNDTTALLSEFLCNRRYTFSHTWNTANSLHHMYKVLPEEISMWLKNIVARIDSFNLYYIVDEGSFENTLVEMTPNELHYIYPVLRELQGTKYKIAYEKTLNFPYLEYLKNVNDNNERIVKEKIIESTYIFFLEPVNIYGDPVRFRAHPSITNEMYLPVAEPSIRHNDESYYFLESPPYLIKMDSSAAIIHRRGMEYIYAKQNGIWTFVNYLTLYIE